MKLLNGSTVELDENVGVIADSRAVESLAGIMGGDATAVGDDTKDVYVEAAFWWPEAIQGRSRRFNFTTDAGHRFERGVDPVGTVEHIERITQLIIDICGGRAGPIDDQQVAMPERAPVTLRVARAAKVIGMPMTQAQCADVMRRLGVSFIEGEGTITVDAAFVALRSGDRGRPDRGSHPRTRLRPAAGCSACGAGDGTRARRSRVAARMRCAA